MSPELIDLISAAAILVGAILLSWVSAFLLGLLARRFLSKTATRLDDFILDAVKSPLRAIILVVGVELAFGQIASVPERWHETTDDIFFVVYLFLAVIIAYRLAGAVSEWYGREVVFETETDLDDKFLSFFGALANILIVSIAIVILLGHFGIEPSALVTTLGIGTLAVALAAQEALSDMISGFMIMLDRPFAIGDRIEISDIDTWGDVTEIGLRSTRILTRDNRLVAVPNSVIGKGLVVNYSVPSTVFRVETHVGVAYGTDLEFARDIMIKAVQTQDWIMHDKPVEALMLEFGDSALVFRVRCWIEHYVETRRVIDKLNTALYHALNDATIEIPFPQRDVRLYQNGMVQAQNDN